MSLGHNELPGYVYDQINSVLETKKSKQIIIGYSGGLDSTVLVHIVANLQDRLKSVPVLVIHIDHGVDFSSGRWTERCQSFCDALKMEFKLVNYSLADVKANREATYRQARYKAFAGELAEHGLLLTAHHRQDQVETVLFNLFRGAGVSGLRGMKSLRKFASGYHLRPLLSSSPECLHEYANYYNLAWIEDPSNQDREYDRNYIRHELLPVIEQRWPRAQDSISRSAGLIHQAEQILEAITKEDIIQVEQVDFPGVINKLYLSVLNKKHLNEFSGFRQRNILRHWINHHTSIVVNSSQIEQIVKDLCADNTISGLFEIEDYEIRVYKNYIYIMRGLDQIPRLIHPVKKIDEKNYVFRNLKLKLNFAQQVPTNLEFKLRENGERIKIRGQTRLLKKLYQDFEIPPWERALLPLIYLDDQFISVAGTNINPDYLCNVVKISD